MNHRSATKEPANVITIKLYRNGKFSGEFNGTLAIISLLRERKDNLKTIQGEVLIEGQGSKNEIKTLVNIISAHVEQAISMTPPPLPPNVTRDLKCRWCKKEIAEKDIQNSINFKKFKEHGLCLKCQDKIFSEEK